MRKISIFLIGITFLFACSRGNSYQEQLATPHAKFSFNKSLENTMQSSIHADATISPSYSKGIEGRALEFGQNFNNQPISLTAEEMKLDHEKDFSIQFWVKSNMSSDERAIFLSTKKMKDNSLASQKKTGWVLGINGGNLFWNIGSGSRRITYQRDNENKNPLNDNNWHLVAMSYSAASRQMYLYLDGVNQAIYNLIDSNGFDFNPETPLTLGWEQTTDDPEFTILPAIEDGAENLQQMVDEFNKLESGEVKDSELLTLVTMPESLLNKKVDKDDWEAVLRIRSRLSRSPYTIHQAMEFMEVAPLSKIYSLVDGEIIIDNEVATYYTLKEQLHQPEFRIDELQIFDKTLSLDEVFAEYAQYTKAKKIDSKSTKLENLNAAIWNIWHGGKHWTVREHGWDSRIRIVEMIKENEIDVIMMNETYSSGEFIAAELGYYYASTIDWDYLGQGSNNSVISRYPILEVRVPEKAPFMNVGAKVELSKGQEMWVMANWYGMASFPDVFEFHKTRFENSDEVPVLFGGDFNVAPHTDGGNSPASEKLIENGFVDAYRSLYPDVEKYPGYSHIINERIDQLYYKGDVLENISTEIVSSHPDVFPSDHYLIVTQFKIK